MGYQPISIFITILVISTTFCTYLKKYLYKYIFKVSVYLYNKKYFYICEIVLYF